MIPIYIFIPIAVIVFFTIFFVVKYVLVEEKEKVKDLTRKDRNRKPRDPLLDALSPCHGSHIITETGQMRFRSPKVSKVAYPWPDDLEVRAKEYGRVLQATEMVLHQAKERFDLTDDVDALEALSLTQFDDRHHHAPTKRS